MAGKEPQPRPEPLSKVRFTADGYKGQEAFKLGEVREMPLSSCRRWVRRGVAEYVDAGVIQKAAIEHEPEPAAPPEPEAEDEGDDEPEPEKPKRTTKLKGVRRGGLAAD